MLLPQPLSTRRVDRSGDPWGGIGQFGRALRLETGEHRFGPKPGNANYAEWEFRSDLLIVTFVE